MNKVSERRIIIFTILLFLFGICLSTYLFRIINHNIKYFFLIGDSIMIILLYRMIMLYNKTYQDRVIKYSNTRIKGYK